MRIVAFSVKNYKSFSDSDEASGILSAGINVIIGQNNSGKTALLEAVTLRFGDIQHRSLQTHPVEDAIIDRPSTVTLDFEIPADEWPGLVADNGGHFVLAAPSGSHSEALQYLRQATASGLYLRVTHSPRSGRQSTLLRYLGQGNHAHFDLRRPALAPEPAAGGAGTPLEAVLADAVTRRIYLFGAERFRVGEGAFGPQPALAPDARNLPEVLNRLQSNPAAYERFNALVRRVLPQVRWISVEPREGGQLRISVWMVDPASQRLDLAVPLNQSGTGVGQVLAILYVAVLSRRPEIIAIDEPQSFLHPSAIRGLLEILREHSHHQFIITTHSPVALTAARPETITHVRMIDGVSSVTQLRSEEANDLRVLLADLGVRMEDVFGLDSVLWVEGPTEELCFPLIIKRLATRPLARTGILGLVATGDLEARHRELAFGIYRRLSEGSALLPPAVAFIFDRERRSEQRIRDLTQAGQGKVWFLQRRMYENYLLDCDAISAVAGSIEGFGRVTPALVEQWLGRRRWDTDLFGPSGFPTDRSDTAWLEHVSGANVLGRAFTELSATRVSYDKVRHGQALTQWLLEHKPTTLQPLADFIAARLPGV